MSIEVAWGDDAKTILRMTCAETWDMDDFSRAMRAAGGSVRGVAHPVYVIADLRATREIPQGITWGLYDVSRDLPPNWAGSIFIVPAFAEDSLMELVAGLHRQLTGRQISTAKTEVEAFERVEQFKRFAPEK